MNGKEKETPDLDVILLGQKFNPFDPQKMAFRGEHREDDVWRYAGYKRTINLRITPQIPDVPIQIRGEHMPTIPHWYAGRPPRYTVMTPFDPDLGYEIDERDFNLEQRIKKIQGDDHWKSRPNLEGEAPLSVFFESDLESKTHEIIKLLCVQLFFPNGLSFESRVNAYRFYPSDIGPLPAGENVTISRYILQPDFNLHVPEDLEKLQQIIAKFVIYLTQVKTDRIPETHP